MMPTADTRAKMSSTAFLWEDARYMSDAGHSLGYG